MALSCGIIGLPMTGKTTLFNLLTGANAETSDFFTGKTATNNGRALVPDERVDWLAALFKPKKTTYAQVDVIDVPGLVRGASQGQGSGNEFLSSISNTDLLCHIVRAFENPDILHAEDTIDIMRDISIIENELLFADLQMIETRLSRINGGNKKKMEHPHEEATLKKCQDFLMEEKPLKLLEMTEDEQESVRHISFLTAKPMMIVVNVDENQMSCGDYPQKEKVEAYCAEQGYELLAANVRCRMGEIDLIAARGGFLVFVEVKARSSARYGLGREAVTKNKQQHILRAAQAYLAVYDVPDCPVRFDVVEVELPTGIVTHIVNAFGA